MKNDLIKKYLADKLSPEERNAFEQEMENDPFLMEAIEGLSMVNGQWSMEDLYNKENELGTIIEAKLEPKQKGKIISLSFFRYAAAACVLGIIGLFSYKLFFVSKTINEQAIYAAYFKPLTHPDATVRGENDSNDEAKAIEAYEKEDYFEAVNAYQKLVANNPDNVKNNLFLGISYLGSNQPKKAIDILSKIKEDKQFQYDVQWYLALAHIKNKEVSQAESILQVLENEQNYYQQKAKEILEKLDGKVAMKE